MSGRRTPFDAVGIGLRPPVGDALSLNPWMGR
jgi:hypothetical protein